MAETMISAEKDLKTEYPEQLLKKYRAEVNKMAMRTSDRGTYRQLAALLRRMKKIEGGSAVVEGIAAEWRSRYRNRRAMMEEIKGL